MTVRYVPKQENWVSFLVRAVRAADRGDLILVDNIEMLCYADMGLKVRGFETHKTEGVRVHIRNADSPPFTVQYGPPLDTGAGWKEKLKDSRDPMYEKIVRPAFPAPESKPLVEVDMKSIDLGEKMHMACQSLEGDPLMPDELRQVAQQEAFADLYGDAKQAAEAQARLPLTTEYPQIAADGVTVVLGKAGVPNANGDTYTAGAWDRAGKEHNAKVAEKAEFPPPAKHTTRKPTEKEIAEHQAQNKITGNSSLLDSIMKRPFYRFLGQESGRWLSQDLTYRPPFFAVVIKAHAPSGQISILDRDGQPISFSKVTRNLLMLAAAFAKNPRAFLEEEARIAKANEGNPCADVLPPYNPKDVEHTASMHKKVQRAQMEWHKKPWKYARLDGSVEREVSAAVATSALVASHTCADEDAAWDAINKAYGEQTAITLAWKKVGETVLVPPDLYPPEQKFVCQHCGKQYAYGESKKAFGDKGTVRDGLCFCNPECGDAYVTKNRRYPAVGAEILLSGPEPCVDFRTTTATGDPRPVGRKDFDRTVRSVGQLHAVDDVAAFFGLTPDGPNIVDEGKRVQDAVADDTMKKQEPPSGS